MKYFSFIFLLFFSFQSMAQSGLVAYFPMDQCGDVVDVTGINNTVFPQGFANGLGCACGVKDSALVMGGEYPITDMNTGQTIFYEDLLYLIGNYDNYFDDDDFTISVYFKATNLSGNRTIYSKLDSCTSQTGLSLRYTPATSFITAFVGESASKKVEVSGRLNTDRCWHHVVLIKKGNRVSLYADGVLLEEKPTVTVMDVRNDAELSLGWGECVGVTDLPFEGLIDELRVYNRAIPFSEIEDIAVKIDEIGNRRDTLIVEGTSVDIFLEPTCIDIFQWSPSDPFEGVEDISVAETTITPPATGTYYLTMLDTAASCSVLDSIHISVVNPDSLDCGEIFLPKAFTPNGDSVNDNYGISNPYAVVDFVSFEIYDRWGGRMFYSEDAYEKWNGRFNGKRVNPGVCVYRVVYNCQGEEKIKLGSLTVLR